MNTTQLPVLSDLRELFLLEIPDVVFDQQELSFALVGKLQSQDSAVIIVVFLLGSRDAAGKFYGVRGIRQSEGDGSYGFVGIGQVDHNLHSRTTDVYRLPGESPALSDQLHGPAVFHSDMPAFIPAVPAV